MLLEKATQKVVQVVILALFTFATSDALVPGGNNVCTKTSTESYSQQIQGTTSCGFWGWRRCAKTTYRRGYRQRQDYECCDGWRSDDNAHCSKAICFGLTAGKCPNGGWCKSPGICSCAQGFKPPKCTDIDECDTLNGGCSDGCVNTVGSYRCSCASGYGVAKDGFNCQPVCFGHQSGLCANGGTCTAPGVCDCSPGFNATKGCADIDECTSGKSDCDQRCVNTPGSFHCECISGYRLAADNTCLPVCGHSPAGTCPNGGSCVSPDNCTCPSGFQTPDCRDIDECSLSTDDCDQNCVNTLGSYRCDCAPGHGVLGDGQGSCLPICHGLTPGECPNGGSCRSPEVCHCLSGFTGNNCTDINECFNSNGGCERECHNEPGSFVCGCPSGYKLLSDGVECADINECKEKNGGCEQICDNSVGSFNCRCRKGFRLDTNNITCTDIDECSENPGFCQHDCVNIPGSFACACNSGYALQSDRKTCTDVDECVTSNGGCEQICINHVGSSECQCRAGYTSGPEQTSCTDIDECLEAIGNCSDLCVNDPGTYHCDCLAGYTLDSDGRTCQDIDECEISNGGCQELCDNSPGSRECSCPEGLVLASDGSTCQDASKCPFNGNINCWAVCTPSDDGTCKCPDDRVLHSDGSHCIDPCYSSPCLNGGTCLLTNTSFRCDCNGSGYTGEFCLTGEVTLPEVITARAGVESDTYRIQAHPKKQLLLQAVTDTDTEVIPNFIVITYPSTSASIKVLTKSRGLHVVTWNVSGADAEHYPQIPTLNIKTEDVFSRLNLAGNVLPKGCFQAEITFKGTIFHLSSTQPWYDLKSRVQFTQGVVFLTTSNLSLPVSENGLEIVMTDNKMMLGLINPKRQPSDGQLISPKDAQSCDEISLSDEDHTDFTQKRSLLGSFLTGLGSALPNWLSFNVGEFSSSWVRYIPKITIGRNVQKIPSCYGAPVFNGRLYYTVRVQGKFVMSLIGESVDVSSSENNEFCFIIGLQNELTLVIMFPDQVSELLQRVAFFKILKNINLNVSPRGIGISFSKLLNTDRQISGVTLWNGDEVFEYTPPKKASLWFGVDVEKQATKLIDYSLEVKGDFFLALMDVRKIFTHLFSDPWSAMLQINSKLHLKLTVPIFSKTCTISLTYRYSLHVGVSALVSLGGQQERQYCGLEANPPGIFLAASIRIIYLDTLSFITDLAFDASVEGFFFRILDSAQLNNVKDIQSNLQGSLGFIRSDLSSLTVYLSSIVKSSGFMLVTEKLQRLSVLVQETSSLLNSFLSGSSSPSVESISSFLYDFIANLRILSTETYSFVYQISVEILSFDWTNISNTLMEFIRSILSNAKEMQITFLQQFNALINGSGSWGVKGQMSVSLLGQQFLLSAEFVSADSNIGHCGRFADLYEELSEEKAVRIHGVLKVPGVDVASVKVRLPTNIVWKVFISIDGGAVEMALAQNSDKFLIRMEVLASIFGVELSTNLILRRSGLSSVFEVNVFGLFRTRLLISANIFVPVSEIALIVQGRFLPGSHSFDGSLGDYIRLFAKRLADSAVNRLERAQNAVKSAKGKLTGAQNWLNEKKKGLDGANVAFDRAIAVLEGAKQKLEKAKEPFRKAMQTLNAAQKRVDGLCRIKSCSSVCIPGIKVRLCWAKVWFLRIPYPCISFTSCMFRIPDPICILANVACRIVRGLAYAALEIAKIAVRIPMVALDLAKTAVSVAQIVVDKSRVLIEVAKAAFDLAVLGLEGVKVILDAANVALEVVKVAIKLAYHVFDFIVQYGLQKIIDVKQCGFDLELSTKNLFEFGVFCELNLFSLGWTKVGFRINFKNLASSLWNAAKAVVEGSLNALGNLFGKRKREADFIIYSRLHKLYRQRRQTSDGNADASGNNTIPQSQFDSVDFWDKQCSTYKPIFDFLRLGVDVLFNVSVEMENQAQAAMENSTHQRTAFGSMQNSTPESLGIDMSIAAEDFNLTSEEIHAALNETNEDDDEVLHESKTASDFIHKQNNESVESTMSYKIIPAWKAEMENLTIEYFNTSSCSGFSDCVVYSFGELYQLFSSVDPDLVVNAQQSLPDLESSYMDLLDNDTREIVDVKSVTSDMLDSVDWIDATDIFCGTIPVITESPSNRTAIEGSDVTFDCKAESIPMPMYYWYKNGQILTTGQQFTSIQLFNISSEDEGVYSCVVGNHMANTTADPAHLVVEYSARITSPLEDLEVLTGAEVSVECLSFGVPFPTISWFTTASLLPEFQSNPFSLSLTDISPALSGLYACEASNVYGTATSTESIFNVFDGTPICPVMETSLGYMSSQGSVPETVLSETGVHVSNFEEGMVSAISILIEGVYPDVQFNVKKYDSDVINVFITVNCKPKEVCTESDCPTMYQAMLEKVQKSWALLQTKFDAERALFTLSDHTYYINPSILDVAGVENECPSGYRQFTEHACVDDTQRYMLPAPLLNDFQPSQEKVISWQIHSRAERFIRGYRVMVQKGNEPKVLLNVTTVASSYHLPPDIGSETNDGDYEILVQAFTASHQGQWARQSVTGDDKEKTVQAFSYLALGLGLGAALVLSGVVLFLLCLKKTTLSAQRSTVTPVQAEPSHPENMGIGTEATKDGVIVNDPPPYSVYPMESAHSEGKTSKVINVQPQSSH